MRRSRMRSTISRACSSVAGAGTLAIATARSRTAATSSSVSSPSSQVFCTAIATARSNSLAGGFALAGQGSRHGGEEGARVLGPVALRPAVGVLHAHDQLEAAGAADVAERPQPAASVERLCPDDAHQILREREAQAAADSEHARADVHVEARPAVLCGDLVGES